MLNQLLLHLFKDRKARDEPRLFVLQHQSMVGVIAPSEELRCMLLMRSGDNARVRVASRDEDHLEIVLSEVFNLFWLQRVLSVAMSQLSVFAVAPAKHTAVAAET